MGAELEVWSSLKIQAAWRGKKGRDIYRQKLKESKQKWKELFDAKKKRAFYFNKNTGEIRWRKPQALLDLMPRPVCGNCDYFEAKVECKVCQEFFCNNCWGQVHFGG